MTSPVSIQYQAVDLEAIAVFSGRIVVFLGAEGKLDQAGRRVNRLMKGALLRFTQSEAFEAMKSGASKDFAYPAGLAAETVQLVRLERRCKIDEARKAGAAVGKMLGKFGALVLSGPHPKAAEISLGVALRAYGFSDHKSKPAEDLGDVTFMVSKPDEVIAAAAAVSAVSDGVFFTRDLINEPSNVLTTEEFADRLVALQDLGLEVEVLDEAELEKLGMRTLLAVGQGSESPTKVVVMQWKGGQADEKPFALVGKGVVFDTGGISLKPAGGMEDMTMDMGGAGVVAGVMKTLALRGAKANVVGLVGLVENMPDGKATRPGDVVKSMKGDTVEIINTDAEGRLVLADVLWYTQERFEPTGVINLATLTGAVIVGLGHENAGVFSNDDLLCNAFLKAAGAEGEGAWRMPMGQAYDDLLKSRIADMKNIGGRAAGSITAAQFIARFIKDDMPWIHLDIAGVASVAAETSFAPKGATGWGVMALDRLIRNLHES